MKEQLQAIWAAGTVGKLTVALAAYGTFVLGKAVYKKVKK